MTEYGKHEDGLDLASPDITGLPDQNEDGRPTDDYYLSLVGTACRSFEQYFQQNVAKSWATAYKAFHNEHADGSKYNDRKGYGQRSRLFRPKTRAAVRKDAAAVGASLFGTVDSLSTSPGNESDPKQVAAAALIQEVVNYRTDRTSGRNAIPWFLTAMGARQDAELTGVCISKQSWLLELREDGEEPEMLSNPLTGEMEQTYELDETGAEVPRMRPKMVPDIDRPDVTLYPPDRVKIDPAADWTNPAQSAAYLILMNPMRIDDIRKRQEDPRHPWLDVDASAFGATTDSSTAQAITRARESGVNRLDRTQNPEAFEIIWVYEVFMRCHGENVCFYSIEDRALLTEPRPVREIYPEQDGDRPITYGYGAIESHRITPMSPVESWQPLQAENNDIINLFVDTLKQSIAPITKVRRGKRVDLAALHRKGPGTNILLDNMEDVAFEAAPPIPATVFQGLQTLQLDMDDLAGQFNSSTVQDARGGVNETVGGLKLIAGAANTVQELDIRTWIETWTEPTLAQVVRLIQFYESDKKILALCGERAKLHIKHGINTIDDDLIESQVSIRVNAGLGAGDPAQKLKKFADGFAVAGPILQNSKEFQTGAARFNIEAVMDEIFGAQGYRDGGKRFIIFEEQPAQPPPPPPDMEAKIKELLSKAEKNQASAQRDRLEGMASFTKVAGDLAIGASQQQVPPEGGMGGGAGMPGAPAPAGGQGPAPPPSDQPDGIEQALAMFGELLKEHFKPKRELIHGPMGVEGARETVGGKETRRWKAKRGPTNELMGFDPDMGAPQ